MFLGRNQYHHILKLTTKKIEIFSQKLILWRSVGAETKKRKGSDYPLSIRSPSGFFWYAQYFISYLILLPSSSAVKKKSLGDVMLYMK